MDETSYVVGSIVWVKLTGGKWWPGEVVAHDSCPEEVTKGLRKEPLAIVKFFDEDFYETVRSSSHIHPFICAKKDEFIKKGRELLKFDPNAEKFDKDVEEAMHLCGVTNEDQSDCSNSFDNTSLSNHYEPLPSKNIQNYGSAMVASSPSQCKPLTSRIQSYGDYKTIECDSGTDVRIRAQPSPASVSKGAAYACDMCSFQTNRIANIIVHHKSHSEQLRLLTYKIGSVKDRGAYSDDRSARGKDSKLTLQKVKRKIFTDSDQESKVKRKPKKVDGVNEGSASASSDVTGAQKKRSHQIIGPDGNPVPKRKRKKEADPDTIFDKMKKQSAKKSRKRGSSGYLHMGALSSPHNLKGLSKRKDGSEGSSDEAEFLISRGVYDGDEGAEGEELSVLKGQEGVDAVQLPGSQDEMLEVKSLEKEMLADSVSSQMDNLAEPMEISEALPMTNMDYQALTMEEDSPIAHSSEFMPAEPAVVEPVFCASEQLPVATEEKKDNQVSESSEETFVNVDQASVGEESAKQPVDKVITPVEEKIASPDDRDLFFLDREPDKDTDIFEPNETKIEADAYLDKSAGVVQEEEFMQIAPTEKEQDQALSDEVMASKVEEILREDDLIVLPGKEDLKMPTLKENATKNDDYFAVEDVKEKVEQVPTANETFVEKGDSLIIDEASLESEKDVTEDSSLLLVNAKMEKAQSVESTDLNDKDVELVSDAHEDRLQDKSFDVIIDETFSEKEEEEEEVEVVVEEEVRKASDVKIEELSVEKEQEVVSEEGLVEVEEMTVEERFPEPCGDRIDSSRLSESDLGASDAVEITDNRDDHSSQKEVEELLVEDEVSKDNDIQVASSPDSTQDIFAEEEIVSKAEDVILQKKIDVGEVEGSNAVESINLSSVVKIPEEELSSKWGLKDDEVVMAEADERQTVVSEELVVEENIVDAEETIHDKEVVDKVMEEIVDEVTSAKSPEPVETTLEMVVEETSVNVETDVQMEEPLKSAPAEEVISSLSESGTCSDNSVEPKLIPLPPSYPRVVDLTALEHEAIVLSEGVVTDSSIIANIPIPPDPSTDSTLLANIPIPPDPAPAPVCVMPPQLTCQLSPVVEEPQVLEYTKLEALMQPQEMEPVYLEPVMDVPIVEGEEIIHIGNEQVIDTSMDVFCNEVVIESDDKEVQEEYDNICLVTDEDRVMMASSEVTLTQKVDDDKIAKFSSVQERQSGEIMMGTTDAINGTLAQTLIGGGGGVCASSMREKSQPTEIGQAR